MLPLSMPGCCLDRVLPLRLGLIEFTRSIVNTYLLRYSTHPLRTQERNIHAAEKASTNCTRHEFWPHASYQTNHSEAETIVDIVARMFYVSVENVLLLYMSTAAKLPSIVNELKCRHLAVFQADTMGFGYG